MRKVRLSQRFGSTMLGWLAALNVLLVPHLLEAQPVCTSGCQAGTCTLNYSASGVVLDYDTDLPIAGAQVNLLDVTGTTASDGSYAVSGSRPDQCHFDYFFSFSVAAPGYETFFQSGYFTIVNLGEFEIRLTKAGPVVGHTVSGFVAEFPQCSGRMRGVTVVLEPIGLTT